jgi:hypothetical protein
VREEELSETQKILTEEVSKLKFEKEQITSKILLALNLPEVMNEINIKL